MKIALRFIDSSRRGLPDRQARRADSVVSRYRFDRPVVPRQSNRCGPPGVMDFSRRMPSSRGHWAKPGSPSLGPAFVRWSCWATKWPHETSPRSWRAGARRFSQLCALRRSPGVCRGLGFPVISKHQRGCGRGMRVIDTEDQLLPSLEMAQREAKNAFGSDEVFIEKLVGRHGISKFRYSAIPTERSTTCMSAIARCSDVIRRLSNRAGSESIAKIASNSMKRPSPSLAKSATTALEPSSSCSTPR